MTTAKTNPSKKKLVGDLYVLGLESKLLTLTIQAVIDNSRYNQSCWCNVNADLESIARRLN